MIPTIESIVEMLIAGECTAQQALSWIGQHMVDQSLRDSFAGFAMQGALSNAYVAERYQMKTWEIAKEAYAMADAMLEARK